MYILQMRDAGWWVLERYKVKGEQNVLGQRWRCRHSHGAPGCGWWLVWGQRGAGKSWTRHHPWGHR